jgi:anti-anti-sigma factor
MRLVGAPPVSPGDHACCVFATDDDHALVLGKFARDAAARGDRIFYLADRSDEASVVAILEEVGLDGRRMLDSGALQVIHSSQMELEDGFDIRREVKGWTGRVGRARNDGYRGLSAAAEMTWALSWGLDDDVLLAYERAVEIAFDDGRLAGLCEYDSRAFDAGILGRAGAGHHYSVHTDRSGMSIDYNRLSLHIGRELELAGEIDLANVHFLQEFLNERLAGGDATVDCAGLTFVDAGGCRLLRSAASGQHGAGRLTLRNTPDAVVRVMDVFDSLERGR